MSIIRSRKRERIVLDIEDNKELLELLSQIDCVTIKRINGKAFVVDKDKNNKPHGIVLRRRTKRQKSIKKMGKKVTSKIDNEGGRNQSSAIIAKVTL